MTWLGIWFEHEAREGGPRDPAQFKRLVHPVIYPYAHNFIENETQRLQEVGAPSLASAGGDVHSDY